MHKNSVVLTEQKKVYYSSNFLHSALGVRCELFYISDDPRNEPQYSQEYETLTTGLEALWMHKHQ